MKQEHPMSIRLQQELVDRLDVLSDAMAKDQSIMSHSPSGIMSRSQVVRMALLEGVAALEQRYKIKKR
jgi:predicted transcriptional regulator